MDVLPQPSQAAAVFAAVGSLFNVAVCYFWTRFADVRDGRLDAPSGHHRIYLRLLIGASIAAATMAAASIIVHVRS